MVHKVRKYPLDKEGLLKMFDTKLKGLQGIELKWVSPDTYLKSVPPIDTHGLKGKSIKRLSERIQKSKPLDPLYLDVRGKEIVHHNGRHRALVSQVLGVEKIPVVIYNLK